MNFVLSILDSKNRDHMISVMTAISKTKNTCSAIARSLKARQADMSRDLAWLLEAGILSKNGVFYRLDDRMLAYWLGSVYQRRKELLVDGTVDKAEIFRRDIKSHIEAFIADDAREPAERVAAIFSSFSNELVQIDDKLMRMPHFTRVETKSFAPRNYIVSAFRTNIWMVRVCKEKAVESDVVSFVRDMKATGDKMACRIIVSLKGIDENARLLAKELKISVWDIDTVNALGECYGKTKIVAL
jgi:DNA-binding transcriptional ArsR family regulator